jgi:hypothetical protein
LTGPRSLLLVLALLLAPSATAQQEIWVLVDCAAHLRPSVLETSSILEADPDRCPAETRRIGAWQGLLRSRHGDLVRVSTVPSPMQLGNACSGGPFERLPAALDLYVPADALVFTVGRAVTTTTRDKRTAKLRPGIGLRPIKGPWYSLLFDYEEVEVKLKKNQLVQEFSTPPRGPCVEFEPTQEHPPYLDPPPRRLARGRWTAPAGSPIYLPTMEQIGETAVDHRIDGEVFTKNLLTCTNDSPLNFASSGVAPLCFLTIGLNAAP